jgi:hypothetical protein
MSARKRKVTGTLRGIRKTVIIQAPDWHSAVRIGSKAGYMLCVEDCVLIES